MNRVAALLWLSAACKESDVSGSEAEAEAEAEGEAESESECETRRWDVTHDQLPHNVLSVWGCAASDVWFVGGDAGFPYVLRWQSGAWRDVTQDVPAGDRLWWVSGTDCDDIWLVGAGGALVHWDGVAFTSFAAPIPPEITEPVWWGVWGATPNEVWAVGVGTIGKTSAAMVGRFDGAAWSWVEPPAGGPPEGAQFLKVWGTARDDVFIVGHAGAILHFDGSAWSYPWGTSVTRASLFTVHGSTPDNIYAVGGMVDRDRVLHYDGVAWTVVTDPPFGDCSAIAQGVFVAPGGDAVVTGISGMKWTYSPSCAAWREGCLEPPADSLHAVWGDGLGNFFAVGGNYMSPPESQPRGTIARFGDPVAGP